MTNAALAIASAIARRYPATVRSASNSVLTRPPSARRRAPPARPACSSRAGRRRCRERPGRPCRGRRRSRSPCPARPGAASSPRACSASSSRGASGERSRMRWASSSSRGPSATSRPVSTTITRSHVAATSSSTWLDSSTVPPGSRELAQLRPQRAQRVRVEPGRRLVEQQDVRRLQQRGGDRQPAAHAERARADAADPRSRSSPARSSASSGSPRPARAAASDQFVVRGAAGMEAVAVEHSGHAAGRPARCPRWRRSARAGSAAWSSCRHRWAPGSRRRSPPGPRSSARRRRRWCRSACAVPRRRAACTRSRMPHAATYTPCSAAARSIPCPS